jgi:hypothetical protein
MRNLVRIGLFTLLIAFLAVAAEAQCNCSANTDECGSSNDDTIVGDAQDNCLDGKGGDDSIYGMAGSYELYGGDGDDTLCGGSGNDFLYGEAGNDSLNGGSGFDTLDGGSGANSLSQNGTCTAPPDDGGSQGPCATAPSCADINAGNFPASFCPATCKVSSAGACGFCMSFMGECICTE